MSGNVVRDFLVGYLTFIAVSVLIFGFVGFIIYCAERPRVCTCEMVKNHECAPPENP